MSRFSTAAMPYCVWTLLCVLLCPGMASALTISVDEGFHHQFVGDQVEYLEDSSGALGVEAASQQDGWQRFTNHELNFGFSNSAYWVRFQINNRSAATQRLVVENRFPLLDHMAFYFNKGEGYLEPQVIGDAHPARDRTILHSHFLLPLELQSNETVAIMIRVQSVSGLQIPLVVWKQDAFTEGDHVLSILYGVFYGLLIAMAIYHLLIFFSIREFSFLYYALFNLSVLAVYACLHGVTSAYIWQDSIVASDVSLNVSIVGGIVFSSLFIKSILQISQARPGLARLLNAQVLMAIILVLSSSVVPFSLLVKLVLLLMGAAMMVVGVALITRLVDGYPPARFIFVGGVFAICGFSVTTLGNIGVIAMNPVIEASAYVGIIVMSMLDAFALTYRMNMDRQLRQDAQAQLIQTQRKTNENLDTLVQERTEELQAANAKLQKISITDGLTQLYNRRYFNEIFEVELKRSCRNRSPLSILMMDIDHFKQLNDT
jgi:hypothetical protein